MAKPPKKPRSEVIEIDPGAEERFERTVRRMLNTPPKPHKQALKSVTPKRGGAKGSKRGG